MSDWLIEGILVKREIHLCGGISGAGKTTWLLGTLYHEWQNGLPILGHKSNPGVWAYASSDRSIESVNRRLNALGIPTGGIPVIPAWDQRMQLFDIIDAAIKLQASLLVIESFGSFCEPPANFYQVKEYMQRIYAWCAPRDLTVIGVMESPKMKPNERYEIARQRISGVAAWGHYAETVFMVELKDAKSPKTGTRILTISDRNASEQTYPGDYASGRLIFV
jgi:RecA-family ATPase